MARIFTTPDTEQTAKALMHDITLAAGLRSTSQRSRGSVSFPAWYVTSCQKICNELVNRDFALIDADLTAVSKLGIQKLDGTGKHKYYKPDGIAKCIVYMAELLNLYWDDTVRTPYEIDAFKNSILGMTVYKYGRYISALNGKTRKSSAGSTARTPGQPPKNGYKQSGPQSGNVRDLRDSNGNPGGKPGEKVYADTNLIYRIIGDNPQSKNIPNVFIRPLSSSGAEGTTNKIFFNSGNGYTDCTCFFDDPADAQDFLDKLIKNNRIPVNISNPRVVKAKADDNGYFLAGTEFGVCAISAKTLNEALAEALTEATDDITGGWKKATENYTKEELAELHTWMRKD